MKKVLAVLIGILFLAGCAGIQFKDEASQTVLYKLAGHRFGYELGKKDPATAQIVMKAADGIILAIEQGTTGDSLSLLLQQGLAKLAASYKNDPALAAEVAIVAELVVFKGSPVDTTAYKAYLGQMKAGMEGFKMGYTLSLAVAGK
jgi:hypothetical protein